jgi:hypothetical protein
MLNMGPAGIQASALMNLSTTLISTIPSHGMEPFSKLSHCKDETA